MTDLWSTRVHRPASRSVTPKLVRLAIVIVALALAATRLATADLGAIGPLLAGLVAVLTIFLISTALMLIRARTEVGPEGIRNRVIGGWTQLRWDELADVRVTTRGYMRTVQVVRQDGHVVRLTALRDAPTMPDPEFDETVEVIRQRIGRRADEAPQETAGS